ncbi:MAG TPA: hypothetical protein VNQ79_11715 [Blastocatellia bacterium]|nr:hypothetical protein [Blastocatellia bacterium]
MAEQNKRKNEIEPRWRWFVVMVLLLPWLIPIGGVWMRQNGWPWISAQMIAVLFMCYWVVALVVSAFVIRSRIRARMARLGSPLVDLPLTTELRDKLAAFAAARRQSLAVTAFDLLDRELPRPERDKDADELERVRRENAQLDQIQTDSQSGLSIAVTVGILRRLLMLNGADEDNRHLWRSFASDTAARIIGDALDHLDPRDFRRPDALAD